MRVSAHTRLAKSAFSENLDAVSIEEDDEEKQNLYLGLHALACALEEMNKKLIRLEHQFHDAKMKP